MIQCELMVCTLISGSVMNDFQCVVPVKKSNKKKHDPGVMYDDVNLSPKLRCCQEEVPFIHVILFFNFIFACCTTYLVEL